MNSNFYFLILVVALGINKAYAQIEIKTPIDTLINISISQTVEPIDTIIKSTIYKENVVATYYSNKLNGRKTASGKRFNNKEHTAAHKKLAFGTKLKVTNVKNGKWVIVTVTDRGPFAKGKEIDLTQAAFKEIAHVKGVGLLRVNIEIL
jgi:rare lipoprotein A